MLYDTMTEARGRTDAARERAAAFMAEPAQLTLFSSVQDDPRAVARFYIDKCRRILGFDAKAPKAAA